MDIILIILLVIQVVSGVIYLFSGARYSFLVFIIVLIELAPLAALIGARHRLKELENTVYALSVEQALPRKIPVPTPTLNVAPSPITSDEPKAPLSQVPGWRCECGHWNDGYTFKCALCYKPRPKPEKPENNE